MQRNDVDIFAFQIVHPTIPKSDVAMGRAVKAVAPDLVTAIVLVRNPVNVGDVRHGGMKGGVEHGHLWHAIAKQFHAGADTFNVGRIVQRRQLDAVLDAGEHLILDFH